MEQTALTRSGSPIVLSAGTISHNSIQLLIITTDFVAHF